MKYKFLEHTADAKFIAYGKDLEEAFANAALATTGVMFNPENVKGKVEKKVKVKAKRIEALLFDFLGELLFLLETEYFLHHEVKEIKIDEEKLELEATLVGDDFRNYELNGDVKSITYNDMEIKKSDEGYELTVVVDI